jgi:hypothetical protein
LGVVPPAVGQSGSRQTVDLVFDEQRPARTSGVRLAIDYINPEDPAAKPPAVQKVVIALAAGSAIDTSVPARCEASNAQLMTAGGAACPAGSRVGGGEVDLDTGVPGPARIAQFDVTEFNNKDELILLLESKSEPRTRIVARSVISGGTITTEVSPVPGGPPDGFTAIKRVRLSLEPVSVGEGASRRSYVTTPDSCPTEKAWTNTVTFTYRDGVSQTVSDSSPCIASDPGDEDGACRRPSSIGFKLHRASGTRVVRVAAYVNGKPVLDQSGRDIARVELSGLPREGRMGIRIVATHSTGSKVVSSRSWKGCKRSKPRVRVIRGGTPRR